MNRTQGPWEAKGQVANEVAETIWVHLLVAGVPDEQAIVGAWAATEALGELGYLAPPLLPNPYLGLSEADVKGGRS